MLKVEYFEGKCACRKIEKPQIEEATIFEEKARSSNRWWNFLMFKFFKRFGSLKCFLKPSSFAFQPFSELFGCVADRRAISGQSAHTRSRFLNLEMTYLYHRRVAITFSLPRYIRFEHRIPYFFLQITIVSFRDPVWKIEWNCYEILKLETLET